MLHLNSEILISAKKNRTYQAMKRWMCMLIQLCPTLCNPMDCSPPGSSVHRILQARIFSGLPCPPPGDLRDPGMEIVSPHCRQIPYLLSHQGSPLERHGGD